jgi:hypothetical protein
VGNGIHNRRKDASERIQDLEADLQELDHQGIHLDTGREWLDRDRIALSSKTLDATVDVDAEFQEYDSIEAALDEEDYLQDLGQDIFQAMTNEYQPFDSRIDRYNITFDGECGSLDYSVADLEFHDEFNEDDERELISAQEVYEETFGDEEYMTLH